MSAQKDRKDPRENATSGLNLATGYKCVYSRNRYRQRESERMNWEKKVREWIEKKNKVKVISFWKFCSSYYSKSKCMTELLSGPNRKKYSPEEEWKKKISKKRDEIHQ